MKNKQITKKKMKSKTKTMTYMHLLIFMKIHNLNFFSLFLPQICSMFPAMILQAAIRTPILLMRFF